MDCDIVHQISFSFWHKTDPFLPHLPLRLVETAEGDAVHRPISQTRKHRFHPVYYMPTQECRRAPNIPCGATPLPPIHPCSLDLPWQLRGNSFFFTIPSHNRCHVFRPKTTFLCALRIRFRRVASVSRGPTVPVQRVGYIPVRECKKFRLISEERILRDLETRSVGDPESHKVPPVLVRRVVDLITVQRLDAAQPLYGRRRPCRGRTFRRRYRPRIQSDGSA